MFGIPLLIAGGSSQTAERRGTAEETNPRWEEKRHNHNEKTLIDKERTTMKKKQGEGPNRKNPSEKEIKRTSQARKTTMIDKRLKLL